MTWDFSFLLWQCGESDSFSPNINEDTCGPGRRRQPSCDLDRSQPRKKADPQKGLSQRDHRDAGSAGRPGRT